MAEEQGTQEIEGQVPAEGQLDSNPFEQPVDTRSPGEQMSAQAPVQQAPQGQAPAQQAQPQWDGSQFQLNYRGQMIAPKSKEELIKLAQQGYSYSSEMAKVNQQRAQLDQMAQQYSQYSQFDQLLKGNPALAQKIVQVLSEFNNNGGNNGNQGQQAQMPSIPPEFEQKLSWLEQETVKRNEQEADRTLDSEVQQLRLKYPQTNWDADNNGAGSLEKQVIQFAYDNNIMSLEYAYKAMMFDAQTQNAKAEALKGNMQQRQQMTRQGIVQGGAPAPVVASKPAYNQTDSYNDLAKKMAEELRV